MNDIASRRGTRWASQRIPVPKTLLSVVGCLVLAAVVLEIAIRAGAISAYLVPRPSDVLVAFVDGLASGVLLYHGGITAFEALTGFAIATLLGLTLAVFVAEIRLVESAVYPWMVAVQATPKIALAPLLIIWFGFGLSSKIAVATIICLFPVMVTTITGLKSTNAGFLDLACSMGASRWQILWKIKFPAALPHVFAGLSLASVFAFTGAIVGEFVGASAGLGHLVIDANSKIMLAEAFAALIAVALLGLTFFYAMQAASHRVLYWKH
ncbi:ABC transporter permease [Acuticoccus mangrovi]|uniref:ABC transporter permease n=1 Tax=Acuticoccus mangrovi TaxID=2796142 RepID=A0A934MES4_9HYPH|nr:ABC transporter permease [Acuticoccus mangrovi]MBJ3774190.1 ABC transporter permease [Acuticoccus mangrovi]